MCRDIRSRVSAFPSCHLVVGGVADMLSLLPGGPACVLAHNCPRVSAMGIWMLCALLRMPLSASTWLWTSQRGTELWDFAAALHVDSRGIFLAGDAAGPLDGNHFAGSRDVFLMKFGHGGAWQWTTQRGTNASDHARAMCADGSGNLLVAGYTFGAMGPGHGSADPFLSKLDSEGGWLWTQQWGTSSWDYARALDVDHDDVLVAGYTGAAMAGDHFGGADVFLAKFRPGGERLFVVQRGSEEDDFAQAVRVDGEGNILVAGSTSGALDGNTNAGGKDLFLAKFDASGSWQWTVQRGGPADEEAMALRLDSFGNAWVAGETSGELDGCKSAGSSDIFLLQLSPSGAWRWTVQRGSAEYDAAWALDLDHGRAVVAGYTGGSLDGFPNAGSADLFVMIFEGPTWIWTFQRGTSGWDHARGVYLKGRDLVLAGSTQGALDNSTFHGGEDIFVMKLQA
ncbi:unnamed protein product [Effrenium voratum]|uniref:Uncharacterized protein n=1 Tax=Effrenium voratum TaxID=2562239 RepID=A0AA36ISB1_9DINO|nr:unnamed protein product [Effrenium voratum]